MPNAKSHRADDPGPAGGRWRGFLFFVPLAVWVLLGAGLIGVAAALSTRFREHGFVPWIRLWGRVPLTVCGVRLEVHGQSHVAGHIPRLVLFNHVSLLDLFVLAALCPPGALVLYKKEFEKVPGLGHALHNLGMIPVDRENLEAAVASVSEAGRRIKEEGATCMIAPEGTRSRKGGLQKFKMGAFHLASEYGIPIVPMIMRGIDGVLPMGCLVVRSGTVRVDFLDPIDTTSWERENLREYSRNVRALFLEYLPSEKEFARGK